MKISFIRGSYLNNFEGQNFPSDITGYSSLFPIDSSVNFPLVKLPSCADLQKISLLTMPIKYIANRTLGDSQILFGLEKHIINSDIVHIGDPHYYYSYQAAVLKSKGLIHKLLSTWWETIPFNNESTRAKKRIKQFTMQHVDHYICYTGKAKQCLIAEGVSTDKITIIPLGVDLSRFYPPKERRHTRFTILFVGRLVDEKGVLDLYEAFKMVNNLIEDIQLKIIGDGPLKNKLLPFIKEDGMTHKVTIEEKSYTEMPEQYRQADVLCVPSKKTSTWEEQYGMVFVEAMASGLPILSYLTGSIPELVGESGLFANGNSPSELATLIAQIIRERKLREKLGTMGRERAEKMFNAQNTRKCIQTLYLHL